MFLTDQFRLLQQRLEDAIPAAKKAFLQQFYSQVCSHFYHAVMLQSVVCTIVIMVALWNRADHYIFILWFLSSIFFS